MRNILNHVAKFVTIVTTVVIYVTVFTGCSFIGSPKTPAPITKTALALNTVVSLTVYDEAHEPLIADCFELCGDYDLIFSRTNEDSELYKLNQSGKAEVSDELLEVISLALDYCQASDGAFDITVGGLTDLYFFGTEKAKSPAAQDISAELPHVGYDKINITGSTVTLLDPEAKIDLGAIAKGYIADALACYLVDNGVESAIIDLGGNILCIGSKSDGSNYLVGVQYPFEDKSQLIETVSVSGKSVVTSGVYERFFYEDGALYHHILNPKTGYPYSNELLSVTIIAERSADADALSTVCFALGLEDGMALINVTENAEAVFVTEDFKTHYSLDFENLYLKS